MQCLSNLGHQFDMIILSHHKHYYCNEKTKPRNNGTKSQLNIYRKFTKQIRQFQLSSHILFDTLCILCNFFVQKSRHQTTAPTSRPLNSVVTVKSFFLRIHKAHKSLVCYTLGRRDQRPCILASCISLWWNWLDVRSNLFLVKSFEGV